MLDVEFLDRDGERIAYGTRAGRRPTLVWLGGFKSEMTGTKAEALDAWAARTGYAFLRFDYFGHGQSSGDFRKGTITRWRDDALAAVDHLTEGPLVLVGSSMGGWIALLVAQLRAARVAGMVLIAPATDFTEALLWARLPEEARRDILGKGEWLRPSAYDANPYPITRGLIEDGRAHLLLHGAKPAVPFPVRILQGMRDPDVPWQHALALAEAMSGDVTLTLVRNGDHRLSELPDLRRLTRTLEALMEDLSRMA